MIKGTILMNVPGPPDEVHMCLLIFHGSASVPLKYALFLSARLTLSQLQVQDLLFDLNARR
jgi:hypothetical protein